MFVQKLFEKGLAQNPERINATLVSAINWIIGDRGRKSDQNMARRAKPLAWALVAGDMAIQLGILPKSCNIAAAVRWAWTTIMNSDSAKSVGDLAADELLSKVYGMLDRNIRHVNGHIHGNTNGMINTNEALGYYDDTTIYLPEKSLSKLITSINTTGSTVVAKALSDRGLLEMRSGRKYDPEWHDAIRGLMTGGKLDKSAQKQKHMRILRNIIDPDGKKKDPNDFEGMTGSGEFEDELNKMAAEMEGDDGFRAGW